MQRALDSAIGLPSSSTSASWMLELLMPDEQRRNFMLPPMRVRNRLAVETGTPPETHRLVSRARLAPDPACGPKDRMRGRMDRERPVVDQVILDSLLVHCRHETGSGVEEPSRVLAVPIADPRFDDLERGTQPDDDDVGARDGVGDALDERAGLENTGHDQALGAG